MWPREEELSPPVMMRAEIIIHFNKLIRSSFLPSSFSLPDPGRGVVVVVVVVVVEVDFVTSLSS